MDREKLKAAIENSRIEWQRHALERMMERGISRDIKPDLEHFESDYKTRRQDGN